MVAKMMSRMPQDVLEAVRSGSPIPDARLQALAMFTKAMLDKRGNPTPDDVEPFLKAGFSEHHILGVILAIAVKTLSNYTNHVFHTPVDAVFRPFEWTKPAKAA
jgi:alkylhydroperoxidase family enzyme